MNCLTFCYLNLRQFVDIVLSLCEKVELYYETKSKKTEKQNYKNTLDDTTKYQ